MYKEQKELHGNKFHVTIISQAGNESKIEVSWETKIEQLKDIALKKLDLNSSDSNGYHIIKVSNGSKKLQMANTVRMEGINGFDSLLLYPARKEVSQKDTSSSTADAPSMSVIRKATANMPTNEKSKQTKENNSPTPQPVATSLEHTFRKILLTLLDLSYQLMFFDEDAQQIFSKDYEAPVDPDLIKQLTDMGFSEKRAREALLLNDMNVEISMEWMLRHPEPMEEDPPSQTNVSSSEKELNTSRSVSDISKRMGRWRKKANNSVTSSAHISSLMDMGFTKEECIEALTYNGNNLNSACNWLLGERTIPEEDPNDTLDPESGLYKAIINNPTIHVGLHNKRVLEALEDMLENPQRRHNWANDPTVGSVILHILKLYHKYSTAVST